MYRVCVYCVPCDDFHWISMRFTQPPSLGCSDFDRELIIGYWPNNENSLSIPSHVVAALNH